MINDAVEHGLFEGIDIPDRKARKKLDINDLEDQV